MAMLWRELVRGRRRIVNHKIDIEEVLNLIDRLDPYTPIKVTYWTSTWAGTSYMFKNRLFEKDELESSIKESYFGLHYKMRHKDFRDNFLHLAQYHEAFRGLTKDKHYIFLVDSSTVARIEYLTRKTDLSLYKTSE